MAIYKHPVALKYATGSKAGVNVWHFRSPLFTVPGPQSISTLIKNFYTAINAFLPTDMSATFDGVLTEVGTTTPGQPALATGWTVTGAGATTVYGPAGVGMVVGWRSALATRRGRGRTFIAPMTAQSMQSDGTILDFNLNTIRNAAQTLVTASLADGNGALVVWSPTDNVGRDVVSVKVNDKVAWLSTRRG